MFGTAPQTIFFSGIGGIGMSGLAQLLAADGHMVSGSDRTDSAMSAMPPMPPMLPIIEYLVKKGFVIHVEQSAVNIPQDCTLFIYTSALPKDHPELLEAQKRGIPTMTYFEAVGEYAKGFTQVIAISGTHGKTTTTALVAQLLVNAQLNPTALVGSIVSAFESNVHIGSAEKELFVVEACEHEAHMLNIHADIIILTNIEADHLDYYRDLDHIIETFQTYVNQLPEDGLLIRNNDDKNSHLIVWEGETIATGIDVAADVHAEDISTQDQLQYFLCSQQPYTLRLPGKFNIANALGVIAVGRKMEIEESVIQKTIAEFVGVWRRFELLGEYKEAVIISDYAHHPTAVRGTIAAAKAFYPDRRIVVVFQPHQRARTQKLFSEFVQSFDEADLVIVQEIYGVAGREAATEHISSQQLVDALQKRDVSATYTVNATVTRTILDEMIQKDDVVLILGAGDIYQLAESLSV